LSVAQADVQQTVVHERTEKLRDHACHYKQLDEQMKGETA
jgi:hypothetical protein